MTRPALAILAFAASIAAGGAWAAGPPRPPKPRGCEAEIGPRKAADLLTECRASRAVDGSCRPDLSCAALRAEIARGCEEAGADALPSCEFHVDPDDEEDE